MRILFVILAGLFLSGCTGNPERGLLIACQGYASVLASLAAAKVRGQLNTSEIATVDSLRPSLNAICIDGSYTDVNAASILVETSMWRLLEMKGALP